MSVASVLPERLGAGLSLVCAVHCLATPLVSAVVPLSGLRIAGLESLELIMLPGLAVVVASAVIRSRGTAWRGAVLSAVIGAAVLLAGGRFVEGLAETLSTTVAALVLAAMQLVMCRWSGPLCDCHGESPPSEGLTGEGSAAFFGPYH